MTKLGAPSSPSFFHYVRHMMSHLCVCKSLLSPNFPFYLSVQVYLLSECPKIQPLLFT